MERFEAILQHARRAQGFMPHAEGTFLYECALTVARVGPLLEVGTYCGKSALYLVAAAVQTPEPHKPWVVTVDHHRGSEENQAGWEHHDTTLIDADLGVMDTLPRYRRTLFDAEVESDIVTIVAPSAAVASLWNQPLGLAFIDGGHGAKPAHSDYENWAPKVAADGLLMIHDVFPDPAQGGRPPYEIYLRALGDGFTDVGSVGSLRALSRR